MKAPKFEIGGGRGSRTLLSFLLSATFLPPKSVKGSGVLPAGPPPLEMPLIKVVLNLAFWENHAEMKLSSESCSCEGTASAIFNLLNNGVLPVKATRFPRVISGLHVSSLPVKMEKQVSFYGLYLFL